MRETGKDDTQYTHQEYRMAGIAHLLLHDEVEEFYYKGKQISRKEADAQVACFQAQVKKGKEAGR